MDNTILQFAAHWQIWTYPLMFLAMFFDANIMILAATFLISAGVLNPYLLSLIVIIGAYAEQVWWFFLGRLLKRNNFLNRWGGRLVGRYDKHLLNRPFHSLVITKFIYGVHRATLMRFGMLNFPVKNFAKSSLLATATWLAIVAGIGFSLSESYKALNRYLKYGEFGLLFLLVLALVTQYFVSRRLRKEL